ncbi:MAG TPA: kelch repeat-containing protein [Pyrinomonadaceae bacterium]|nr:kelch repeat-containing protein [Pyrinomonadaceae bacterium]
MICATTEASLHIAWDAFTVNLAVTNPTPQTVPYTQDFSLLDPASSTYPDGWQAWAISTPATTFSTAAPGTDTSLTPSGDASMSGVGAYNYNGKIGFLSGTTGPSDESLVLALDTTGKGGIQIAYDIMTIRDPSNGVNTRINEVTLQYRLGTTGTFTTLTGMEYQNNRTRQVTAVTTPVNLVSKVVKLPAAINNQPIVQLRWISRQVSGTGGVPSFAVDNIAVTLEPIITPSTTSMTFPDTFVGNSAPTQSFTVSGFNLPSFLQVTPPNGFLISLDANNNFSSSPIIINAPGGAAPLTTVYVKFVPPAEGPASGNIALTSPGAPVASQNIAVSGNGILVNSTLVGISNSDLVVTDNGGTSADNLTMSLVGAGVRTADPGQGLAAGAGCMQIDINTVDCPVSGVTGAILVSTLGGNDTLTLSLNNGNFIPAGGVTYDGGAQNSTPGDKLVIAGGNQGAVTYNYTNAHDGSVVMSNLGTIRYNGLEPITNSSGNANAVTFNLPAGAQGTFADDGVAGNGIGKLTSTNGTFESTTFVVPTNSLTINQSGNGTVIFTALDSLFQSLGVTSVTLGGASTDTFLLGSQEIIPNSASLTVNGATLNLGSTSETVGGLAGNGTITSSTALGAWTAKAALPTPRWASSVGAINGTIYVAGGYNGSHQSTHSAYNTATNTWSSKNPFLQTNAAYGVMGGALYCFGGTNSTSLVSNVWAYEPVGNTWAAGINVPDVPRQNSGGAVLNDKFYLLGGRSSTGVTNLNYVNDRPTGVWSGPLAPMPTARSGLSVAAVGNIIYAIGGDTNSANPTGVVEAYDPVSNTWSTKASMPTPRFDFDVAVLNGLIYAIGGTNGSAELNTVEVYDPATNTWSSALPLPTARAALVAATVGNTIYAIGGYSGNGTTPRAEVEASTSGFAVLTVGNGNTSSTFNGSLSGITLALTKIGTGTLTLSGTNTYSGATTVSDGYVNVNGSLSAGGGTVTVGPRGNLGGTGTVARSISLISDPNAGGRISPGNGGPGILNTNSLEFTFFSTAVVAEIGGPMAGNTIGDHDQINVTGTVNLGSPPFNAGLLVSLVNGFTANGPQALKIINNDGNDPIVGTFGGLPQGAAVPGIPGSTITYTGGDGNDVVILVPDTTPPAVPTITGSTPASPNVDYQPFINGTAEPFSTVRLWQLSNCNGGVPQIIGQATATAGGTFGIQIQAPSGSSITVYANTTDAAGNVSPCSSPGYTYVATATQVTFSGRIYGSQSTGFRGVTNARITLTDDLTNVSQTVVTGRLGAFSFTALSGRNYTIRIQARRFTYSPFPFTLGSPSSEFYFYPTP